MHFLYLDEAGGTERPDLGTAATPVMVILGVIVEARLVPLLTREFMALKRRYFPGRFDRGPALDHVLTEVKGSEVLRMTRSTSRDKRRQAALVRHRLLDLADRYGCRVVGRVWVKQPGLRLKPAAAAYRAPEGNVHATFRYQTVRDDHGPVLRGLQHRYVDAAGRWRGGIVVSDPGGRPGSLLFGARDQKED